MGLQDHQTSLPHIWLGLLILQHGHAAVGLNMNVLWSRVLHEKFTKKCAYCLHHQCDECFDFPDDGGSTHL
jgi:hypothetical protein